MPRALLLLLLLTACDAPAKPVRPAPLGSALARVDGHAIGRAEVEALARSAGITPKQALHDLVSERLLVAHAQRRGYGGRADVRRGEQQALVRALLAHELGESDPAKVQAQRAQLERLLQQLAVQAKVHYDDAVIARAFHPEN